MNVPLSPGQLLTSAAMSCLAEVVGRGASRTYTYPRVGWGYGLPTKLAEVPCIFGDGAGTCGRVALSGRRPGAGIELQSVLLDSEIYRAPQNCSGLQIYDDVKRQVGVSRQIQIGIVDVGLGVEGSGWGGVVKANCVPAEAPDD